MGYFLRQDRKKNKDDIYLQMYETYWDKARKQARTRCIESFGYVSQLTSEDIPDPISYYKDLVQKREEKRLADLRDETRPRAFDVNVEKNAGYFLLASLLKELDVKPVIDILSSVQRFQFSVYEMLAQLIYSRVIRPCSKSRTAGSVFPLLFNHASISEDQIYDGLFFVGETYNKYIELFNHQYEKLFPRNVSTCFFDCTNYYFEIDCPRDDKQKGPSKENRHDPIVGQALLLDADLVPLSMHMYPGNESEKPHIRAAIEEMKTRSKATGRTIQVADKGLNCARNIYAAVKEADDGYIFSKSMHGRNLSQMEKTWVLLEDSGLNKYTSYHDEDGKIKYRIKSCIDDFEYRFQEIDPDTGEKTVRSFTVKERRIVSFNPSLAVKQRAEILKMAEKASTFVSYKDISREELGDSSKYITINTVDKTGKRIKPIVSLNQAKIDEDLRFAGYNLLVTSELDMSPNDVYKTYHSLWKIEESFRITKSYLDARPVFVQKRETIYGHFLVCYLCLFLLRVLEIKCFKNKVSSYDLIEFIRDFRVAKLKDDTYLNLSHNRKVNTVMKKATGISTLDALYLSQKEIDNLFRYLPL